MCASASKLVGGEGLGHSRQVYRTCAQSVFCLDSSPEESIHDFGVCVTSSKIVGGNSTLYLLPV